MCISRLGGVEQLAVLFEVNADVVDVDAMTAQQVETRTYRQPLKPRLPRRLTTSARINLNHHWSAMEELITCTISSQFPAQTADHVDNEINENLANERLEESSRAFIQRYVPVIPGGTSPPRTVVPEARSKSKHHFWNVFRNQSSKRKTPSILKIIQTLSNQSQ